MCIAGLLEGLVVVLYSLKAECVGLRKDRHSTHESKKCTSLGLLQTSWTRTGILNELTRV